MVLWMMSIAVSVCLLVLSAALGESVPAMVGAHLFVAGLVSTAMALLAIGETRKMIQAGESQMTIASSLTRYMGLVWAWAVLVVSVTYGTGILQWSDWLQYVIAFTLVSGLCLFLSRVMHENAGSDDHHLLQVSRYMAAATLLVSVVATGIFGVSKINGLDVVEQGIWAANNVLLFGAIALASISAYLLKASVNEAH